MIGQADQAMGNSRMFYQQYRNVGGHNGHFEFPTGGDNGWGRGARSWPRCPATSSARSGSHLRREPVRQSRYREKPGRSAAHGRRCPLPIC
ncbi:MPT51/MPB51 antigen domain protein [Mycobacterium xenopi 4042]|uniref:MPT51/MPB51 antigen domain protein n=1 Tax=Mycobacterium xenopi 4042 TaxID=1299334 RepID=X8DKZ9_MYCXE|nr:MPT51/MPB51 antigen domain protein [Mycobacterium xenopi 4042]